MNAFEAFESNVRYYCRRWPAVFATAQGSTIVDEEGTRYLDFFAGAGALSYGHNNPVLVEAAVAHLRSGALMHSLDTFTPQKRAFLETIEALVLAPRGLDMVVQTVGPTGATAVEAALQLAQRVTGHRGVLGFVGGYHGMSYRAASVSGSMPGRQSSQGLDGVTILPFVEAMTDQDLAALDAALDAPSDGVPIGAVIIEPTQGEGGARPFDPAYLAALRARCRDRGIVVIADEVQAGVGRTGPFFSFEGSGLDPDIICVSKSISGLGVPMAINLVRRSLDEWGPGDFTGTFRGNNLAFATSTAMLETYWTTTAFAGATSAKGELVRDALQQMADEVGEQDFVVRGSGLLCGLDVGSGDLASAIADAAFERQLIVETCGAGGATVKLLPALVTTDEDLLDGLNRLADAVVCSVKLHGSASRAPR